MRLLTKTAPVSAHLTQVTCSVRFMHLMTAVMKIYFTYSISEGLKMLKRWALALLLNMLQEHLFSFTCVKAMAGPKRHRCHCCPNQMYHWHSEGKWIVTCRICIKMLGLDAFQRMCCHFYKFVLQ